MLPPPMPPDPLLTEIAAELGGGGDDAALVEAQAQAGAAVPIRMAGQLCMA
jgi:hypothetical protein